MQGSRATLVVLALGLAGCASTTFDYKGADAGYVVASLMLPSESHGYDDACLSVRRKGSTSGELGGSLCATKKVYLLREDLNRENELRKLQEGRHLGGVAMRPLAPGDYEVFTYTVYQEQTATIKPNKPLSIPFTVKAGRPTYIGQYQWTYTMGKNLWGQDMVKGATVSVANRMARDMEKAAAWRGIPKNAESAVPTGRGQ